MSVKIVLDTETTGLDPRSGHKILEIGAIKLEDNRPTTQKFHHYINPKRDIPLDSYNVHGISESFVADKPTFDAIADELLEFVKGSTLIIHNAPFDIKFLNYELNLIGKGPLCSSIKVVDTLQMARSMYPGKKASLDALCERFKIDLSNRKLHGALKDAELLAGVYYFMTAQSREKQCSFEVKSSTKVLQDINKKATNLISKIVKPSQEELQNHLSLVQKMQNSLWTKYKE